MIVEVQEGLLSQCRQLDHDQWDEIWDGVRHVVPPPSGEHQRLNAELAAVLVPLAREHGLLCSLDTGQFDPVRGWQDYRQPDLALYRHEHASARGIEGRAELVVEIRSPRDETYEKLPFYARQGVPELLVVHPGSRTVERFALHHGLLLPAPPDERGAVVLAAVPLALATVATSTGPGLQLTWPGGERTI